MESRSGTSPNWKISSPGHLVESLTSLGLVSQAEAIVATSDTIVSRDMASSAGALQAADRDSEAIFDLASLTKPFTATLAVMLDEDDRLPLDTRVGEIWGRTGAVWKEIALADLLRHESGLLSWAPLYHLCDDRNEVEETILNGSLLGAPAGTYSDLGYVLWGLSAERALQCSLGELFVESLSELSDCLRRSIVVSGSPVLSTHAELDTEVEQGLAGELGLEIDLLGPPQPGQVQDGNARFLGGLGGHAGLFGTARSLAELGEIWLSPDRLPLTASPEVACSGKGRFGLGWARAEFNDSAGNSLSRSSFGHNGFTGCSLWVDTEADRVLVLAAHRTSTAVDLTPWRRAFHDVVMGE